jgi:geranylgeranyl pyrophosphate synthase
LARENASPINFSAHIQDLLLLVEERMRSQADNRYPDLKTALAHLLSSGGKRIRPALALLVGKIFNGESEKLVALAAAIELLHTATLVHDDLIDGAYLRRGVATLNSQWSSAATVLTGDFLFARAAKLAAETESVPVLHLFAETLTVIVNGEITQLFSKNGIINREQYNQRIYAKTASLFESATKSAAILSTDDPEMIEIARLYGYYIGMAFQIVDDILDFTGEQSTVGKPIASDLRNGIITLPSLMYLDIYPNDPNLVSILNGIPISDEGLTRLITVIRESGAVQQSMREAECYVTQGLQYLEKMPEKPERHSLADLANYIVDRKL